MQNFAIAAFLLCFAAGIMAAPAPSPARQMAPIDIEAIHNKVRSGAVAVANAENPRSGRVERVAYNNGDLLDGTILDDRQTIKAGEEMLLYETAASDEYYDLDC